MERLLTVLCETFKVVMKGQIISYEPAIKKLRQKRLVEMLVLPN